MKQKLRFLLLTLLTAVVSAAWGQEVSYDFTDGSWSVKNGALTNGTVSFTGQGGANFKMNTGYFIMGKSGAYINFPVYDFNVEKIEVIGNSGASADVKMNIFVGNNAVSTETKGSKSTNTYEIESSNQAAGTQYTLKVTSSHNAQITGIKIYKANGKTPVATINSISPTSLTVNDGNTFTADIIPASGLTSNDYIVSWERSEASAAYLDLYSNGVYTAKSAGTATVTVTVTPNKTDNYNAVSKSFDITIETGQHLFDFPWTEDFSGDYPMDNYTYGNSSTSTSQTQTYNANNAGGTAPELLIAKGNGFFTTAIKMNGNYGEMLLTFKANGDRVTVTGTNCEIGTKSFSNNTYTIPITVVKGTEKITLTFTNTTTSNVRVDDFSLTLNNTKSDPELSYATTSFTATVGGDFTAPTLVNPHELTGITYSSSDEDLARVDETTGEVILGDTEGTVTITATFAGNDDYNEGSASYTITISLPELPDPELKVTNAPNAMYPNNTVDLAWTSNSTGAVTFSSNNTSVVAVDANGKLTAAAAGTATITVTQAATEEYSAGEVTFTVTVTDPATSTKYVKVTNANQLKAGNEYIIVAEESKGGSYAMGAQSGQFRNAIPVVISDNEVYVNNATDLILGGKAGMWTLTAENGMLCLVNVPESGGKIESTNNAEATDMQKSWRINEESFTVANRENPYWIIQMNYQDGDPRFACYRNTGNLNTACLYVKDPFTTDDDFHADPLFSIDNIIVEMGDNTRQLVVNTPSDGKPNISFTFDDTSVAEIVNNGDGTYTVNPLAEGVATVTAALPRTENYELADFTFTIKVVGQFDELASDVYQKVTSNDDLTTGKYLIVYEGEDGDLIFDGNIETLNAIPNVKEVTITDNKIYSHGSYFMIDREAGSIQSQSGYYIGRTSDSNGMNTDKSTQYTNSISIDSDGNAVILASGKPYLRYNPTSNCFRYYKSTTYTNQQPIQLYKAIVEKNFEFDIAEAATDGTDHYATIADLGLGYFKVNGINGGAVDVYTVVADGDKLSFPVHFSAGEAIPGNGAYLVKGAPGHYKFPATISPDEEVNLGENKLYSTGEGNLSAENMAAKHDENTKFYKLSLYKGKVGFFYGKADGSAFNYGKGHQAYLAVPAESTGNAAGYFFDGTTTTDISEMPIETAADNATYSISGIRMDSKQLPKGIYIMNGRKVVIK